MNILFINKNLSLLLAVISTFLLPELFADSDRMGELEKEIAQRNTFSAANGLFRVYAVEALADHQEERALQVLVRSFQNFLGAPANPKRLNRPEREVLIKVADAYLLLRYHHQKMNGVPIRKDVAQWLFNHDSRLSLFIDTVTLDDDWPQVHTLLGQMYDHDPDDRDKFLRLILALAVVWDQARPPVHNQMGNNIPPYNVDIEKRYDYFKQLFQSGDSKIDYRDLSVSTLTFVVDTPVPLEELYWIRRNVDETLRNWQDLFFSIKYRHDRVTRKVFQWPHGTYSLAAIQENGGICVDQAYFSALAARAYGIPALVFVGSGRRGPHAWLGYFDERRGWTLDAGRYAYDNYATGHVLNPQVNKPMTDHDLEYICDSALQSSRYADATHYGRLAAVLLELGYLEAASTCARISAGHVKVYDLPWRVQETVLRQQENRDELLKLFEEKANVFRKYPDYVATIRYKQAELLQEMGREKAAKDLLARTQTRLGRDRDDLARILSLEQVRQAYEKGDAAGARKQYEDVLQDQRKEGQKVIDLIEGYLALTLETEQTHEAARFLRRYLNSLQRLYGNDAQNERVFLNLLKRAYENDKDSRNIERTQRKLDRLK